MADDMTREDEDMSDDVSVNALTLGSDEEEDMPADFSEDEVFGEGGLPKEINPLFADDIAADKDADFSEPTGLSIEDDEEAWFAEGIREGAERGSKKEDDEEDFGAYGYSIVDGDNLGGGDSF